MKRIVLKFGGTSVADRNSRQVVASIIQDIKKKFDEVIVVVSAMGRRGAPYATDTLLQVFSDGRELPKSREQDMIYACGEIISGSVLTQELKLMGIQSIFLTGGQAGIRTNDNYSDADIITVHTEPIEQWLQRGYVVIVAGGQGTTETGDFTAIGRGGSDTTACAIGYYINADEVRIYTDVDGIYTGDPRVIKKAKKIPYISYEQCHKLAEHGAKIIHPQAVAYSEKGQKNVLSVRSTFINSPGTNIGNFENKWSGITALRNLLVLTASNEKKATLKQRLAEYGAKLYYILEDETGLHCSIEAKFIGMDGIPEGRLQDAIFVVGPSAKIENVKDMLYEGWDGEVLRLSDDSVAVTVAPELYEQQINLLHDGICLV